MTTHVTWSAHMFPLCKLCRTKNPRGFQKLVIDVVCAGHPVSRFQRMTRVTGATTPSHGDGVKNSKDGTRHSFKSNHATRQVCLADQARSHYSLALSLSGNAVRCIQACIAPQHTLLVVHRHGYDTWRKRLANFDEGTGPRLRQAQAFRNC